MGRHVIAILIICYAIAFAFGAMAAIRWPSLMTFAVLVLDQDPVAGLGNVNWRELGIAYGAPYFLAALCFYASALSLPRHQHGSFSWFVMGSVAGFPCVFLVDFEPGWWQDPSAGEGAVAGAAAAATLLGIAVWVLRRQRPKPVKPTLAPSQPDQAVHVAPDLTPAIAPLDKKDKRRGPVPAAIARQRAHFAAEGRRMRERQRRQVQ